jgi:hypothetical protein
MQKAVKVLGLALLLSAISNMGSVAAQNGDDACLDRMDPFLLDFAIESYTKSTGALTLKVTITYCPETPNKAICDLLTLSVYTVGGLAYTGEDTLQIPYRGGNPISVLFNITVPPNDTGALVFLWECDGMARWDGERFVTTGDTLEASRAGVSWYDGPMMERSMQFMEPYLQQDYERAKREWEAQQESLKQLYPPEGTMTTGKKTRNEAMHYKIRMLEMHPLTNKDREEIWVGDTIYVRERGEIKFQVVVPQTMEEIRAETLGRGTDVPSKATKSLPPFSITLEPVTLPQGNGPAELRLQIVPRFQPECDVTITVTPLFNLTYTGEKTWVTKVKKDSPVSYTLKVIIPQKDTSGIEVMVDGGSCGRHYASNYFVTTGDTVEVTPGNPRYNPPKPHPQSKSDEIIRDTLTEEQLQAEYEVVLDLRDPADLKLAQKILETLPKPIIFQGRANYYKLTLSLQKLIKLGEEGIEFDFTTPPPWAPEYSPPKDSVAPPPPPPPPQADEINVDTLTPQQMQSEHEVLLWFRDSTERKLVEQMVGHIPDSAQLYPRWNLYRVKMTLEKFLEIRKLNVDAHLEKPRERIHQAPKDNAVSRVQLV